MSNNNNMNMMTGAAAGDTTTSTKKQPMALMAASWAATAGQAVQRLTVKKYALPDKTVASQVLMYRQLLHTACRPGLRLSREYQGTPAQVSVQHMPWWSKEVDAVTGQVKTMQETRKMVISYDNLIRRLWAVGALHETTPDQRHDAETIMPPIPHEYWVSRLGFQQPDPVTDFRSGGILSLAMMVWIVESCPAVYKRFCRAIPGEEDDMPPGDASVLPFGITSINVTDMMSKFLMLSKSTDRMDALLSQKPFWSMFSDPNALLACQELALDMLADVVQELVAVRREQAIVAGEVDPMNNAKVTVFDFSHILAVTEKRVEFDLLGAGPVSVKELRMIHKKLQQRYLKQLVAKLERIRVQQEESNNSKSKQSTTTATSQAQSSPSNKNLLPDQVLKHASSIGEAASGLAGNMFSKIKSTSSTVGGGTSAFASRRTATTTTCDGETTKTTTASSTAPTPPPHAAALPAATTTSATETVTFEPDPATTTTTAIDLLSDDDGWSGADIQGATDQVSNFSIGGDDDDDDLLL